MLIIHIWKILLFFTTTYVHINNSCDWTLQNYVYAKEQLEPNIQLVNWLDKINEQQSRRFPLSLIANAVDVYHHCMSPMPSDSENESHVPLCNEMLLLTYKSDKKDPTKYHCNNIVQMGQPPIGFYAAITHADELQISSCLCSSKTADGWDVRKTTKFKAEYRLCDTDLDDCSDSWKCAQKNHQIAGCVQTASNLKSTCSPLTENDCDVTHNQEPNQSAVCTEDGTRFRSLCLTMSIANKKLSKPVAVVGSNMPCPVKSEKYKIFRPGLYYIDGQSECSSVTGKHWKLIHHYSTMTIYMKKLLTLCFVCHSGQSHIDYFDAYEYAVPNYMRLPCKSAADTSGYNVSAVQMIIQHLEANITVPSQLEYPHRTGYIGFSNDATHVEFNYIIIPHTKLNLTADNVLQHPRTAKERNYIDYIMCHFKKDVLPSNVYFIIAFSINSNPVPEVSKKNVHIILVNVKKPGYYECSVDFYHCGAYAKKNPAFSIRNGAYIHPEQIKLAGDFSSFPGMITACGGVGFLILICLGALAYTVYKRRQSLRKVRYLLGTDLKDLHQLEEKQSWSEKSTRSRRSRSIKVSNGFKSPYQKLMPLKKIVYDSGITGITVTTGKQSTDLASVKAAPVKTIDVHAVEKHSTKSQQNRPKPSVVRLKTK